VTRRRPRATASAVAVAATAALVLLPGTAAADVTVAASRAEPDVSLPYPTRRMHRKRTQSSRIVVGYTLQVDGAGHPPVSSTDVITLP
jgi:hypothetical protein